MTRPRADVIAVVREALDDLAPLVDDDSGRIPYLPNARAAVERIRRALAEDDSPQPPNDQGDTAMTEMRRTPDFMTADELADTLTRLAEAIRGGDSLEGNVEYLLPDEEHPCDGYDGGCPHLMVTAGFRVGNRQGQGGMQFIGGWEPVAEVKP